MELYHAFISANFLSFSCGPCNEWSLSLLSGGNEVNKILEYELQNI